MITTIITAVIVVFLWFILRAPFSAAVAAVPIIVGYGVGEKSWGWILGVLFFLIGLIPGTDLFFFPILCVLSTNKMMCFASIKKKKQM